jgi:hypothetical protein
MRNEGADSFICLTKLQTVESSKKYVCLTRQEAECLNYGKAFHFTGIREKGKMFCGSSGLLSLSKVTLLKFKSQKTNRVRSNHQQQSALSERYSEWLFNTVHNTYTCYSMTGYPVDIKSTSKYAHFNLMFSHLALGRRLRNFTGDSRERSWFIQRIGLAIQRGNSASVLSTMSTATTFSQVYII